MYARQQSRLSQLPQSTPKVEGEQMYLVRNHHTGHEVRLAAGSEQNARGRAIRNDPDNFTSGADISVTLLRTLPPARQDTQPSTSDLRTYRVTNNETGNARLFPATSQENAINVARREYPALFSTTNVTAALEYEPARISDIRTYRVTNNETGNARLFAATSQEDAINVARRDYPAMFNTINVTAAVA
jgi:hypothetical protein